MYLSKVIKACKCIACTLFILFIMGYSVAVVGLPLTLGSVLLAGVLGGSFAAGGAFDPLALVCALVPGVAGIVCAAIGVPDKARTED